MTELEKTGLEKTEPKKGSKMFALDVTDLIIVAKGALLVGFSAALTYLGENLANVDIGPATAFIVPVVTLVVHALARWLTNYSKK